MKTQTYLSRLLAVLTQLELVSAYEYVVKHNPGNELPYHNLFHTQCMALSCYAGAHAANLPLFEQRALVLAALLHDYDHSGGLTSDAENIQRACEALKKAGVDLGLPEDLVTRSLTLISATQFPPAGPAKDESERIIRDGDMCQMLYEHWFEQVYIGLRAEMVHTRGPMTLAEFCELQRSFFGNMTLHSIWGQTVQDSLRDRAAQGVAIAERAVQLMAEHSLSELDAYNKVMLEKSGT